jgi:rare lipoprotein A
MRYLTLALILLVSACGSSPQRGGYYKDDGPGANPPANLASIPDAVPRSEPLHKYANRPYEVLGKKYVPLASVQPFTQRGVASWYGKKFHGQKTSSGETYDMYKMTAAHPTLPIPSYARVTNLSNGRSVVVRVNDRGPFHNNRIIDLSYAAAYKLGYIGAGSTQVQIDAVVPAQSTRRADAAGVF